MLVDEFDVSFGSHIADIMAGAHYCTLIDYNIRESFENKVNKMMASNDHIVNQIKVIIVFLTVVLCSGNKLIQNFAYF